MFRHILVPTDGSPVSASAVHRAVSFAKEIGARITFFYALPDFDASPYGEAELLRITDPVRLREAVARQCDEILSAAAQVAQNGAVECDRLHSTAKEPYEAIIDAAKATDCDLIMMASHGYRGVKGLLLGSQTQKVLTHSRLPVLVLR